MRREWKLALVGLALACRSSGGGGGEPDGAGRDAGADAQASGGAGGDAHDAAPGGKDAGTGVQDAADDTPPPLSDPCTRADLGNDDAAHATPYLIGTSFTGCFQSYTDKDFYQFTTPATPAAGGYAIVSFTDVAGASIDAFMFVAGDPIYIFEQDAGVVGAPLTFWFAVAPSTTYAMRVEDTFGFGAGGTYTFQVTFMPVDDPIEPNDSTGQATPLTLGTPVQSLAFRGYVGDTNDADPGWEDWYHVVLADKATTVHISNTPPQMYLEAYVFNTDDPFSGITGYATNAPAVGTDIVFTIPSPLTPGNYVVEIRPTPFPPDAWGGGTMPPSYAFDKYTLVVTQ